MFWKNISLFRIFSRLTLLSRFYPLPGEHVQLPLVIQLLQLLNLAFSELPRSGTTFATGFHKQFEREAYCRSLIEILESESCLGRFLEFVRESDFRSLELNLTSIEPSGMRDRLLLQDLEIAYCSF